ncbi:MAG TPA: hypothetical protein VH539_10770 [Gemmatimonadaceae bacterium]
MPLTPQAPTTPGPPTPPVAAPPPATLSPFITFTVPQTAREVANLRARRQELSNQIENVMSRRRALARQYESATGADRTGLQQQLGVLDQRIAQMELDLAESGRALTNSPVLTTSTGVPFQPFNMNSGQVTAVSIVFIVVVLAPLAGVFGRLIWHRSTRQATPRGWDDASHRLERLEQAVDTIAVEMERVSEGQRFITKLMTQREGASGGEGVEAAGPGLNGAQQFPALGPGAAEPIVVQNQRDEVRVRRG